MRSNIDSTKHVYSTKIQSYRHIFTGYVYKKQPEKILFLREWKKRPIPWQSAEITLALHNKLNFG